MAVLLAEFRAFVLINTARCKHEHCLVALWRSTKDQRDKLAGLNGCQL